MLQITKLKYQVFNGKWENGIFTQQLVSSVL